MLRAPLNVSTMLGSLLLWWYGVSCRRLASILEVDEHGCYALRPRAVTKYLAPHGVRQHIDVKDVRLGRMPTHERECAKSRKRNLHCCICTPGGTGFAVSIRNIYIKTPCDRAQLPPAGHHVRASKLTRSLCMGMRVEPCCLTTRLARYC